MPKKKVSREIETIITARFIAPESNEGTMKVELNLARGGLGRKSAKIVEKYVGSLTRVKRKK